MNDSPSPTSPSWPTHWPKDSFTGFWSWALAVLVAMPFVGAFVLGLTKAGSVSYAHVTPLEIYISIGGTLAFEGILVAIVLLALPRLSEFLTARSRISPANLGDARRRPCRRAGHGRDC